MEGRIVPADEHPGRAAGEPQLALRDLTKVYGGTLALDGAQLTIERGTIHALVGGNGSGKSTLIKILAGIVTPDEGTFELAGVAHDLAKHTPAHAKQLNLTFVHQQSSTFPTLTVAENLSVGRGFERDRLRRIRWRDVKKRATAVLDRFEIDASPDAELSSLGSATQTMVAIARALQDQEQETAGLLVLDEPTASLPAHEVDLLLSALQRYARRGHTILYVTHRLEEVLAVADAGTVLRDGATVGEFQPDTISHDALVTMIMGTPIEQATGARKRSADADRRDVVVDAHGLGSGQTGLRLHAGEVVGLAGILGSGRTRLLRQIFGLSPGNEVAITIDGQDLPPGKPRRAMAAGVAYVPEDRPAEAMFANLDVTANLAIASLATHSRHGRISGRSERNTARDLIDRFLIRTESEGAPLSSLSGGNQQKVILARWLQRHPRVLLLDEPTQGVDAGARADIHALVRTVVDQGATALLVSSDFEELVTTCDRVLIMRSGRVVGELSGEGLHENLVNAEVYEQESKT